MSICHVLLSRLLRRKKSPKSSVMENVHNEIQGHGHT